MTKTKTSIEEKSVLLVLEFKLMGNTRTVDNRQVTVDAEKDRTKTTKKLIESPAFDAIRSHDSKTRAFLYSRSLPSLFKEGVFRIPNTFVADVDDYLIARATERKALVKEFRKEYVNAVKEAATDLRSLFNPADYPHADDITAEFNLQWSYVAFSTPDTLKGIKSGLFEREKKKTAELFRSANEEIKNLLRASTAELVNFMVEKLSTKPGEKTKRIHESTIAKYQDFLATFDARNLVDDTELKGIVDKAKKLISTASVDDLKEGGALREKVKEGFTAIKSEIDKMIVVNPARKFSFED
jgi:hypothetical protein